MADKTGIQWTDATWNPVTGCTKVSPGCANCYIEKTPPFRMKGIRFERGRIPVTLYPGRLDMPLKWRQPRRVFVCSMSDLFHEDVPDHFIERVFQTMYNAEHHTFQILTKRPERMATYLNAHRTWWGDYPQWKHVWLGVSAENQAMADERIPILLDTPAAKRFVSCEPLLGPLDLSAWMREGFDVTDDALDALDGAKLDGTERVGSTWERTARLDWVIVGGESGGSPERALVQRNTDAAGVDANQAPAHLPVLWEPKPEALEWLRSLRDQCQAAGVPLFVKQWGGPTPKAGGRTLDGRTWDEFPERVAVPA